MAITRTERLEAAGWTRLDRSYECGRKGPQTDYCMQPAMWVRPTVERPACGHHALAMTLEYDE
jgi:hypothetical protein